MACKFFEMLESRWAKGGRVCVGLDTDYKKLPSHLRQGGEYSQVSYFNEEIVRATHDVVLAYKPNIAFYSGVYDERARHVLRKTISFIRDLAPDVPIILDAKRADIGNTNNGYVEEAFYNFEVDAMTVNPYLGMEAMEPFLDQKDRGIIVLCRTSNPGAGEFQDLPVRVDFTPTGFAVCQPFYEIVATNVAKSWNVNQNCALVVGATYPEELKNVRKIVGDMWLLVPGVGTQGGDVEKVVKNGLNSKGHGLIINSSSGIIFASSDKDFAEVARSKTIELTDQINSLLVAA